MKNTTNVLNASLRKLFFAGPLLFVGCSGSPSSELLGSYFPSWMICSVIGVVVAVIIKIVFKAAGFDEHIPLRLAVYPGIIFSVTFFTWLVWFGN